MVSSSLSLTTELEAAGTREVEATEKGPTAAAEVAVAEAKGATTAGGKSMVVMPPTRLVEAMGGGGAWHKRK